MIDNSVRYNPRSLQVLPGDKAHMEVYAKYIHPDDQAKPELVAIGQIMAAITGVGSSLMLEGTAYGTTQNALPFNLDLGAPVDENEDYAGPLAYLNYVFVPLDFDLTRMGLQATTQLDIMILKVIVLRVGVPYPPYPKECFH